MSEATLDAVRHYRAALERAPRPRAPVALVARLLRAQTEGGTVRIRPVRSDLTAEVVERQPGAFVRAVAAGSSGVLIAYANGEWHTSDLYGVMQALLDLEARLLTSRGWIPSGGRRRAAADNSAIALHYDLPASFFDSALSSHSYSAARLRFAPHEPERAYAAHFERIVGDLPPAPGHLLDLGCGWGGFAEFVLTSTSHEVTCVTLSRAQIDAIERRLARHPARDRLRLIEGDFTELESLPAKVDAVVMLESIEHLGHARRAPFLRALRERYPSSPLVVQSTTKAGRAARARTRERTALVELIFPGPGQLPTAGMLRAELARAGYRLQASVDQTTEFALTALGWMHGFAAASHRDDDERRLHRLFAAYCAGTAASLDRGLARNILLSSRPEGG